MDPAVLSPNTEDNLKLSAATEARLDLLGKEFGSPSAVIEEAVILLLQQTATPKLSEAAKARLTLLSKQYNSSPEEVIQLALDNLYLLFVNSFTDTRTKQTSIEEWYP